METLDPVELDVVEGHFKISKERSYGN